MFRKCLPFAVVDDDSNQGKLCFWFVNQAKNRDNILCNINGKICFMAFLLSPRLPF